MDKYIKQVVYSVLSFIAEKLKMGFAGVKELFFKVIWDDYQITGIANEIVRANLSAIITRGRTTILEVMDKFIVPDSVLLRDRLFNRSTDSRNGASIRVEIEPGTTHIDGWMTHLKEKASPVIVTQITKPPDRSYPLNKQNII